MSKYVQLVEDVSDLNTFIDKIEKDCQFFLGMKRKLYRGIKDAGGYGGSDYGLLKRIKNRIPRDTQQLMSEFLDMWLKSNGVTPRSEGVFCSNDMHGLGEYGKVCLIFPVGKFNAYYIDGVNDVTNDFLIGNINKDLLLNHTTIENEIIAMMKKAKKTEDVYAGIEVIKNDHFPRMQIPKEKNRIKKVLEKIVSKMKFIENETIVKNNLSRNFGEEIVLDCDKYYYISEVQVNTYPEITNRVNGLFL